MDDMSDLQSTTKWQRIEGALILAAAILIAFISPNPFPIWAMLLVFFAPDLSFFGYIAGPRIGATAYNLVHIYAFGLLVAAIGYLISNPFLITCGVLWAGHSGFDRALGYGLKLPTNFKDTHLGRL